MSTPVSIKERLNDDMKTALRAGDKGRLSILRLALAHVQQREVDTREPLDDPSVQTVIERMIKQGRDALAQYESSGREDLASRESAEISILQGYLPEALGTAELEALIADAITSTQAQGPRDMGRVMARIKERAAGRTDMREVSAKVRAALTDG